MTLTTNPGAFLGLGQSLPAWAKTLLFQGAVSLVVLGLFCIAVFVRGLGRWQIIALALLAAGGLGNLIDRVLHDGLVTDFLDLGIGSLRTGIFNIADLVEACGVALFFLAPRGAAPRSQWSQRGRGR